MSDDSRSEFVRNVATLMTGTSVAQAMPVAVSPVLTRLYGPEDFGVLALFIAVTAIFGAAANARYDLAIMLPHKEEDALNVAALGLLIAFSISMVLLLTVMFFSAPLSRLLGNEHIRPWLFLAPLTVFCTGLFNVLNYYNSRLKHYADIARANILKSVVMTSVQLIAGFFKVGAGGLVMGHVASALFANTRLLRNTLRHANWRHGISLRRMYQQARCYRDFPLFSLPAILANALAQHLTNILVSAYFGVATLGQYALVQRVLGIPTALVGAAVGQVFFQQAAAEKRRTGKAASTFDATVKKLVLISIPSFALLMLGAEDLFAFAFGERWRMAGSYMQVLTPFFAVRFVVAAVSTINTVFEKQRISLVWQLFLLVSMIGAIIVSYAWGLAFHEFIVVLSVMGTIAYTVLFFLLFMVSRGKF